jgi:hypothetical protein
MLWNEFVKLSHISKLPLNEQVRKFNEHTLNEENLHFSSKNVIGGPLFIPITITNDININDGDGIITNLFINGVLSQTQINRGFPPTYNRSKTVNVDVSSKFYVVINQTTNFDGIQYTLRNNGVFVNSNQQFGSGPLTSPTFTAAPGGNYVFDCKGFSN